MVGFSFMAMTHMRLAQFLNEKCSDPEAVRTNVEYLMGKKKSFASFDAEYHYKEALRYFLKTEQLLTARSEYRNTLSSMVYLEGDINENSYHFGAALDRYMLVNGKVDARIKICEKMLRKLSGPID
jgi:hypothetical protein